MLNTSKIISILFLSSILNLAFISKSYAYLDPGTGSMILQMIAAIVAGLLAFSQYIKIKIKKLFGSIFKLRKNKDTKKN